jgi:hypothetical protein
MVRKLTRMVPAYGRFSGSHEYRDGRGRFEVLYLSESAAGESGWYWVDGREARQTEFEATGPFMSSKAAWKNGRVS